MADTKKIAPPLTDEVIQELRAGDSVLIDGIIYTARDSAHQRMIETMDMDGPLPFNLEGQIIYYAGPAPAKPGDPIGSIGPTTSGRMDRFTPRLIESGLKGMIGKGNRSENVKRIIQKHKAVYFAAIGGAAALMARCVRSAELAAYEDLGPEAILKLEVKNFPAVVVNDCYGGDLYQSGMRKFRLNTQQSL
ncbi:Fe-S-containing hydro-lyase [bacterium]|nr:Fe-S-containing hydro-lyase [bacterium]